MKSHLSGGGKDTTSNAPAFSKRDEFSSNLLVYIRMAPNLGSQLIVAVIGDFSLDHASLV